MPGTTQATNWRKFSVENSQTIFSRCLLSAKVSKRFVSLMLAEHIE